MRVFVLSLVVFLFSGSAFSQEIEKYVFIGPADRWVEQQKVQDVIVADSDKLNISYQLVDRQNRISKKTTDQYIRTRYTLNNTRGVEKNSTVEIDFDPEYQTVKIHEISITRDGKKSSRLNFSDLQLYRLETDREKLLYNGTLQVALVIPDVRVGDVLDFSYTKSGGNPALGKHFFFRIAQQYSVPVHKAFHRTRVEGDIRLYQKSQANGQLAKVVSLRNAREYIWKADDIAAGKFDDNIPNWYYSRPALELSSFKNWQEVSRFFVPHYQLPKKRSAETLAISEKIMLENPSEKERTRAALDFVQREIRYLGIELGAGGYQPRPPGTTLRRRFGDCKDMTLLLLELLSEMGIEAIPLLVNSKERSGVIGNMPGHAAFNHVIVMASVNGKSYFLDPTTGVQLGTLDTFEQGDFGYGLPITAPGSDMIAVKPKGPKWRKDFKDTFNLVAQSDTVLFSADFGYFGSEADAMSHWLAADGEEKVAQSFLDYFKDIFPSIEESGSMQVSFDKPAAHVKFSLFYRIPDAWEKDIEAGVKKFTSYPYELKADFPKFDGASRVSSYAISHPERTRHQQKYVVEANWKISDINDEVDNDSFVFSRISKFSDGEFLEKYEYVTKRDYISAEDFEEVMGSIRMVRDDMGMTMRQALPSAVEQDPVEDESPKISDEELEAAIDDIIAALVSWLIFVAVFALIASILVLVRDRKWRKKPF